MIPGVRSMSAAQSNNDCAAFCTQLSTGPARRQGVSDAVQGQGAVLPIPGGAIGGFDGNSINQIPVP